MRLESYASDVLEDAMILAQTKAINSFSFRDQMNTLTELWGYCYEKIALIETGYYSVCQRLTDELTHLPKHVRNSVQVFSARDPVGFTRRVYTASGMNDLTAPFTYHISGNDLYCRDVRQGRIVWLEFVPEPPFVTFTKNNRDYKIFEGDKIPYKHGFRRPTPSELPTNIDEQPEVIRAGVFDPTLYNYRYGMWRLTGHGTGGGAINYHDNPSSIIFTKMVPDLNTSSEAVIDVTESLQRPDWRIITFILDYPYAFITYRHEVTGDYESYISNNLLVGGDLRRYNPFDFTGRFSNVEFLTAKFNDYTGEGVTIKDHNDIQNDEPVVKFLGFTPDTLMIYPTRIMYNYLVSHMAQRLAASNNSTIMAVELAVVQSEQEMAQFMKKNQSAWKKINNVTGPNMSDFL